MIIFRLGHARRVAHAVLINTQISSALIIFYLLGQLTRRLRRKKQRRKREKGEGWSLMCPNLLFTETAAPCIDWVIKHAPGEEWVDLGMSCVSWVLVDSRQDTLYGVYPFVH